MATRSDNTLNPSNSTDANFRGWAQFVEDTLVTTGGWVVTSDTGQMTISTATAPGAANTKVGYRIYRMNDSLSGSYPFYMKIYYGSGTATANPGMWLVLGTGSNGSGTITGIMFSDEATSQATVKTSSNSTVTANVCYGSASTGRVTLSMFTCTTGAFAMGLGIERSVDTSGAATGEGFILCYTTAGSPMSRSHFLVGGANEVQTPVELGLAHIISSNNPSAFGGNVGIGLVIPIRGVAKQPGYNWAVVKNSDFTAETTFTMTLYSTSITYLHCNQLQVQHPGGSTISSSIMAMRYD